MVAKFGIHFNTFVPGLTELGMYQKLKIYGGTAARLDANWADYQDGASVIAYSATSSAGTLGSTAYNTYLTNRGYGTNGVELSNLFSRFKNGSDQGFSSVFNLGDLNWAPGWSKTGSSNLINKASPGEFLADFIQYASKQTGGFAVLEKIAGWQMFNEVNYTFGTLPGQLPYNDYFSIIENAIVLTKNAYAAVNWSANSSVSPPSVIGPSLGGVYAAGYWSAPDNYTPANASATNNYGNLDLQNIALHPYGITVESHIDPLTGTVVDNSAVVSNLTFERVLMPTDDYLTWKAMVDRSQGQSFQSSMYLYSQNGSLADQYFDRNAGVGLERTMTVLNQQGYNNLKVNLTEFGASSFAGEGANGNWSLQWTTFADPFKYGYYPAGTGNVMPQWVANNLQAETIVQTVGLIESWDFVSTATAYTFFDRPDSFFNTIANPADRAKAESLAKFGLALSALVSGNPEYKVAGLAYNAYMSGTSYDYAYHTGGTNNYGVDIHISSAGATGSFNALYRDEAVEKDANEIILLRDGNDIIDGFAGDDIIFGGDGNDNITGGEGYDKLYGGAGDDSLYGANGADRLEGGAGNDYLHGGSSWSDQFVFAAYASSGSGNAGADTIGGFEAGTGGDVLMITGGFSADMLLNNVQYSYLVQDIAGGVMINYADNGASIFLQNILKSQLTVANFYVLEADLTVGTTLQGGAGVDSLTGTKFGDAIYGKGGNDSISAGAGDDWILGGAGADTIDGGAGYDWADYSTSSSAITINLTTATASGGDAQGDVLSNIEKVQGSIFADTITGNADFNHLGGGSGNDVLDAGGNNDTITADDGNDRLIGGAGADSLDGGIGTDTAEYTTATSGIAASLLSNQGTLGDALGDTFTNIENLTGSAFADTLVGNAGVNVLTGGNGNDTRDGGVGADTMVGGTGDDLYFVDSTADVVTEASASGTDTISSTISISALAANIEKIILTGTAALNATGNSLANTITGNSGNNSIAGGAGADILNGGAGYDLAEYVNSALGVTITLSAGAATGAGGDAAGDSLTNFEAIGGSNVAADNLTGDVTDNGLWGNGGNDTLKGAGGNDQLSGGTGNDNLTGGTGNDAFDFGPGFGKDIITDFQAGAALSDYLQFHISTAFDTYAEVYAAATQVGANTVITITANDTITLNNVVKTSLVANDFWFV